MIEFAPNPSGPAHLGTLRTYAVAWLEAKKLGIPVFLRFDAQPHQGSRLDHRWKEELLAELAELDMSPDAWQYLDEDVRISALPGWAEVREFEGQPLAYYPEPIKVRRLPSSDGLAYHPGSPVRMDYFGKGAEEVYLNSFARLDISTGDWVLQRWLVRVMHMHLRGAVKVARGLSLSFARAYLELPARRWFGFRLPSVLATGMVTGDSGAFRKTFMDSGDFGTVGWALREIGASRLRERILASAGDPNAPMAISALELVGL